MALPLYAFTMFVSAFILFLVQPIIGKILLPKLGGTPQVWNTCMVFFQMVLLAGYAYTHNATTRLNLRQQLLVHTGLLFLPLIMLVPVPFAMAYLGTNPDTGKYLYSIREFVPDLGSNPIPSTLSILFLYVALPFVVVATSAPLLQRWFGHTGHPSAKDPYFLYGASNFGSMLSLILYPIVIEPYFRLGTQTWIYAWGYFALVACVLACAAMVWGAREADKGKNVPAPKPEPAPASPPVGDPQTGIAPGTPASAPAPVPVPGPVAAGAVKQGQPPAKHAPKHGAKPSVPAPSLAPIASDEMTPGRRFRWVLLAAVPSSLMLGITTHITTDLSPIPLFWLVPLILYLGSFILVFMRWPFLWTERAHEPSTAQGGVKPHTYMLYAQPFFLFLMIMVDVWNLTSSPAMISVAIFAHVMGFFLTVMVCHGELAKDRPGTRHLTEFYLWMSVGGMVGGMFNALVAPVVFPKLWELPIAIFAAALVRPRMFDTGLIDNFVASFVESPSDSAQTVGKQAPKAVKHQPAAATDSLVRTLDWALPLGIFLLTGILAFGLYGPVSNIGTWFFKARSESLNVFVTLICFGVPLILACEGYGRPLRIGLGIGAVLLMYQIFHNRNDGSIHSDRSYFGTISVKETKYRKVIEGKEVDFTYRQLVHGHINHGLNYTVPEGPKRGSEKSNRGDVERDLSRLATTYYHREGPVGRVMEKYNWFYRGGPNTYHADARMPASLIASLAGDLATSGLPLSEMVTLWSEPPIATVGLGTGTMASYGRPYQHVHFYEIDNQILRLNLIMPSRKIMNFSEYEKVRDITIPRQQAYFNYLERAMERGSIVQVLMGDARLRMALPYRNHYLKQFEYDTKKGVLVPTDEATATSEPDTGGGPQNFYHMMVVDAFSSDAIPAHLLTEEAFKMYFDRLVPEGVLCVHTSNRFVDLPKVVAAVADKVQWFDYEVKLDSVDDAKKADVVAIVQGVAGLTQKEATDIVNSTPKATIKGGLTKDEADSLKKRLDDLGAKAEIKQHSYPYKSRRGHDVNDSHDAGHYTSEWVMVARKTEYILQRDGDDDFNDRYRKALKARPEQRTDPYWDSPTIDYRYVWTDDYYNLLSVVRFR